jgi:hypothetical protein
MIVVRLRINALRPAPVVMAGLVPAIQADVSSNCGLWLLRVRT